MELISALSVAYIDPTHITRSIEIIEIFNKFLILKYLKIITPI